jgi:hypothetical protein
MSLDETKKCIPVVVCCVVVRQLIQVLKKKPPSDRSLKSTLSMVSRILSLFFFVIDKKRARFWIARSRQGTRDKGQGTRDKGQRTDRVFMGKPKKKKKK